MCEYLKEVYVTGSPARWMAWVKRCDSVMGNPGGQQTGQYCLSGGFYAAEGNLNTLMKTLYWQGKGHRLFLISIQDRK